ncbi:hypothetical protein cyc_07817 [Cyclospora cayetanensis]|uniref:Uncharacterized protein n=1 Tax=Cyclospora cayetanensis TaxID=88456 RepID=A0A1D3CU34_9EIME|nr:hypothetical protein cyc_07817 [Cyclospora cayetanensis]
MSSLRDAFKEGEIPQELCTHCVKNNEGLTGEWTIIADHRSDGLREITEFFGLDPRDRTAWEFSLHLNAPRLRLDYIKKGGRSTQKSASNVGSSEGGGPLLKVTCHGALHADCPRAILFDGIEKKGYPVRLNFPVVILVAMEELVPHAPLRHMASGCEDGTFLAAEIDGILFVKYEMRRGTFYITRILLDRDPSSKERGPITLAQYCVITKDGEKHVAHRYHKRVEG